VRLTALAVVLLGQLAGVASAQRGRALGGRTKTTADFDWDGNVLMMPTRIYLKHAGGELAVSPSDWVRFGLRQPGRWPRLSAHADPVTGSFREMYDQPGRNLFVEDTRSAIARRMLGPEWAAFLKATSTRRGASRTGIITGRNSSRETVHAGLRWLVEAGVIRHAPPKRNIYVVNGPSFRIPGMTGADSQGVDRKILVMRHRLDALQKKRPTTNVLAPDATGRRIMHVYRYSDDDFQNFRRAVELLSAEAARRWPDVKIIVSFSDHGHPSEKPRTVVLLPGGGSRPATALD
jgi:hypothetical protein